MLENIRDTINGDYELVDGMDELPEDEQEKVKRAIEQGHVDEEDWQHVIDDRDSKLKQTLNIHRIPHRM